MANIIGIVGDTSTGKSTAIETLDPSETYVINVKMQPLPFKDSKNIYSYDNKNLAETDN